MCNGIKTYNSMSSCKQLGESPFEPLLTELYNRVIGRPIRLLLTSLPAYQELHYVHLRCTAGKQILTFLPTQKSSFFVLLHTRILGKYDHSFFAELIELSFLDHQYVPSVQLEFTVVGPVNEQWMHAIQPKAASETYLIHFGPVQK